MRDCGKFIHRNIKNLYSRYNEYRLQGYPEDPDTFFILLDYNFLESLLALADDHFALKLYLSLGIGYLLVIYSDSALLNKSASL